MSENTYLYRIHWRKRYWVQFHATLQFSISVIQPVDILIWQIVRKISFRYIMQQLLRRWDFCRISHILFEQLSEFVLIHHMFTICSLYIHYIFTIYSLYIHHIFTICSLYIHYIFTIYSLYIHYIFTIYLLYIYYIEKVGLSSYFRFLAVRIFLNLHESAEKWVVFMLSVSDNKIVND